MKTLEMQELEQINGGFSWKKFLSGAAKAAGGVVSIVSTSGAGMIPGGIATVAGVVEIVDGIRD